MDEYLVPTAFGEDEFYEKKSHFIGRAWPVETEEEAKAIVLKHAGVAEADVIWERSEYELERGTPEWDVDFRSGDWEYDYEIDAETGKILSYDKDL